MATGELIHQEYGKIYAEQMALPAGRRQFVTFRREDGCGWGNRMESILTAFRVALISRRIFVVDYDMFDAMFVNPFAGTDWRWATHQAGIESVPEECRALTRWGPSMTADVDVRDWAPLMNASDVVQVSQWEFGFGEHKFVNELYERGLVRTDEIATRAAEVAAVQLAQPTKAVNDTARAILRKCDMLNDRPLVVIQLRAFVDRGWTLDAKAWSIVRAALQQAKVTRGSHNLFITTDDVNLRNRAQDELAEFGSVGYHDVPGEHSGEMRVANLDNAVPNSLAEWFIMSEADVLICTMTSFCSTAAKRNGYRAQVFNVMDGYGESLWVHSR